MQRPPEERQELTDHARLSDTGGSYPGSDERLVNARLASLERDGLFLKERIALQFDVAAVNTF